LTEPTIQVNADLGKPATVLIEKISDAVGGYLKPWQMRRVAKAERDVTLIAACTQLEVSELERRALGRFLAEEARRQANIEAITYRALPMLENDVDPNLVEDDWIVRFFDRCRLVSDDEVQLLWSRLLAGEVNNPGSYSMRTLDLLQSMDKSDALQFSALCRFSLEFGELTPVIFDLDATIYRENGLKFDTIRHLGDVGLISIADHGYLTGGLPESFSVRYGELTLVLEFEKPSHNEIATGNVLLSRAGRELASICRTEPIPELPAYLVQEWTRRGYRVSLSSA